ncbi:hypothetical protein AWQ21_10405 [Picosynechococcus sp. PCC 7003]|nr:hypothetical protein AWQ21_10405 [Picosynechococcus sp. PCC 7003]
MSRENEKRLNKPTCTLTPYLLCVELVSNLEHIYMMMNIDVLCRRIFSENYNFWILLCLFTGV